MTSSDVKEFLADKSPLALAFVVAELAFTAHILLNVLSAAAHFFFVEPAFSFVGYTEPGDILFLAGIPYYDAVVQFASMVACALGFLALCGAALCAVVVVLGGVGVLVKTANEEVFG